MSAATTTVLVQAKTLAIALAGGALFMLLGLPLPWLIGPMLGCLAAALAGQELMGLPGATSLMRTILGVAVGASLTPALWAELPSLVLTLALMPVLVLLIGGAGYPYFRKVMGFDHPTAWYAAMPGGLADMLIFGEEAGADPRALSLVHATRVLLIVTVLPLVFSYWLGIDFSQPPSAPAAQVPVPEMVYMVIAAIGGWQLALRIGLFGAAILGPMAATGLLAAIGLVTQRPPSEAIFAAQFFIGFSVGVKYSGITARELRRFVVSGIGFTALILTLSLAMAALVIWAGLLPMVEGILVFAPGGQSEMALLAIMAGADVGLVVAHHIIRVLVVIVGAPVAMRVQARWRG